MREVLAGPAVGDELLHAAQRTHGVAGGPEGRSGVFGGAPLVAEHVGNGVHRFETGVGLHRTVADAQHQHGGGREALADVSHHLLDLAGVVGVVAHARLHDVESVLQDHEVVPQQGVHLRIDRRIGPEHRLPVVAAHRVVVHHHAVGFEHRAVADESLVAGEHLERERADVGSRDGDLAYVRGAFDREFTAQRVVERQLHAAFAGADEEDPRRGAAVEPLAVVAVFPAGRSSGRRLADPARNVEVLAQVLRRGLALHDVVGGPAFRLGFDRAAERRQGRGHRREARASAAVSLLEPFTQVGREDVAFDERVAQHGDAHRTPGAEQRVVESPQTARIGRAEILDLHQRRVQPGAVGNDRHAPDAVRGERPFEGDLYGARCGIAFDPLRFDPFGDLLHIDVEILLVEERRLLGRGDRVVERHEVREDIGPAEFYAAQTLRGDETDGRQHCDQRQRRDPSPVDAVFFGGVHPGISRAVRGLRRPSREPTRRRSVRLRDRCVRPSPAPLSPERAALPASCG